jgi:galactokinase/mevalonate kinase-like predicted kinase
VLAVTLPSLGAHVAGRRADELAIEPPNPLVEAAARRLGVRAKIAWSTTIPRSIGLGGSSALVIATLRAFGTLDRDELAELALAVEVEDLGIAAGPQDRYAQAYGGLTFMEFAGDRPECNPLDPSLLPPLVVAWRDAASEDSGAVHGGLRETLDSEPLRHLADAARKARRALIDGDLRQFARCVDASFDARAELMTLDPRHVEMITTARAAGASANYTGSGGAIVAVCRDRGHRASVEAALERMRCRTLALP